MTRRSNPVGSVPTRTMNSREQVRRNSPCNFCGGTVRGANIPFGAASGDLFDFVKTETDLTAVVADVSGKGVRAARLSATLQLMIRSLLVRKLSLAEVAAAVNRFICDASEAGSGPQYATLVIARLGGQGRMEYLNCGHIAPLLVRGKRVMRLWSLCPPVGLFQNLRPEGIWLRLEPGDRVVVVTDGITEAENLAHEFFGDNRLESVAAAQSGVEPIFSAVHDFRGDARLRDDCTIVELSYGDLGELGGLGKRYQPLREREEIRRHGD